MPVQATTLRQLLAIRSRHRDMILTASRRLGSALGFKLTAGTLDRTKPSVIVFVPRKAAPGVVPPAEMLPPTLDGPDDTFCFTDVIETVRFATVQPAPLTAENNALIAALQGGKVGIIGGIRIVSGAGSTSGTAACVIRLNDTGKLGLLTNRHVAQIQGAKVFHPDADNFEIGIVKQSILEVPDETRFPGVVDDPNAAYRADCSAVTLHDHTAVAVKPGVHGIGALAQPAPLDLNSMGPVGMAVQSVGSTRGRQSGTIIGVGYRHTDAPAPGHSDLLIVADAGSTFSAAGDSGKLIVSSDGQNTPIGLLWGGEPLQVWSGDRFDSIAYATDISWALQLLNASIYQAPTGSDALIV